MQNKISLIIHGPFNGHQLPEIRKQIDAFGGKFDRIIIVSYSADYEDYKADLARHFDTLDYQIIQVRDVLNPGFANINRQVVQMQAGLAAVPDQSFVIKLRNDQNVDLNELFAIIDKYQLFCGGDEKILTTNCFSRKDRLYHPSDMFLCAFKSVMAQYFDYPFMHKTEIQCKMEVAEMFARNLSMTFNPISPESELFRNFLNNKKWNILETQNDSESAIKKFFYLFNSWDINFRWKKKRHYPFKYENEIILPHYFTLAPFDGAPIEVHRCWLRHEIMGGYANMRDRWFIRLAKNSSRGHEKWKIRKYKIPFRTLRRLIASFVPFKKWRRKIRGEDIKRFRVQEIIAQIVPNAVIIPIHSQTKGAMCTALLGTEHIDNEEELLLLAIDDFIDDDVKKFIDYFRRNQCEAGVVSFTSVHPRYSFAKLDEAGTVVEVSEKRPISKNALVSFYYFRNGQNFVSCAMNVIRKDNPIENAFYISQTLNEMILLQKKIGLYKMENDKFHPLKTDVQLAQYLAEIKDLRESK